MHTYNSYIFNNFDYNLKMNFTCISNFITIDFLVKMASASSIIPSTATHGENPEKSTRTNFKKWQQKMLFYLTTMNLAQVLYEDVPMSKKCEIDKQVQAAL